MSPGQPTNGPESPPRPREVEPVWLKVVLQLFGLPTFATVTTIRDQPIPLSLRARVRGERSAEQKPLLAVNCGSAFGGVAAACFPDETKLGGFIDQNPVLKSSLVTFWEGALLLWLRSDFLPTTQMDFEEILLISAGLAPLGWLEKSVPSIEIFRSGLPQTVPYDKIRWPQPVHRMFRYERLRSIYGPLFLKDKGRMILNLNFWAPWVRECLGLEFDTVQEAFSLSSPAEEKPRLVSPASAMERVTRFLQSSASHGLSDFPLHEIRPRRIRELLGLMKAMGGTSGGSEAEGLEQFLRLGIRREAGSDLTSLEAWEHYKEFCELGHLDCYTQWEFLRILPRRVRLAFGLGKPHSIQRNGKAKRGFHDLALVKPSSTSPNNSPAAPVIAASVPEDQTPGGQPPSVPSQ
jgi:hypothetical protein